MSTKLWILVACATTTTHAGWARPGFQSRTLPSKPTARSPSATPLATAAVRGPSFKLPTIGQVVLPTLGYSSLAAATAGAFYFIPLTWTSGLLVGWCIGMPVFSVMSAAFLGGPGIAKALGGAQTNDPRLEKLANEAAAAVGVPSPQVFEVKSREPNAFAASGFGNSNPTVAVTSGLRDVLSEDELAAVLAHEMGHLRHKDVTRNLHIAAAAAGLGGFYELGRTMLDTETRKSKKSKKDDDDNGNGVAIALMIAGATSEAAAHLIRLAASRGAELRADRAAAEAYGSQTLINALKKIDSTAKSRPADLRSSKAAKHFAFAMISDGSSPTKQAASNGFSKFMGRVGSALRTHPTLEKRVEALEAAAHEGLVPASNPNSHSWYTWGGD